MHSNTIFRIVSLILTPQQGCDAQYRREYRTHINENTLQSAGLRGVLKYDANAQPALEIEGGWAANRYVFTLHATLERDIGGKLHIELMGYTDRLESELALIESNMRYIVNSVNVYRETLMKTPEGDRRHIQQAENSNVLSNPQFAGSFSGDQLYKLRPEDVYAFISRAHLGMAFGGQDVVDVRTMMDVRPMASKRTNAIPGLYLETLIDGFIKANKDDMIVKGMLRPDDVLDNARGYVQEAPLFHNPFFRKLSDATNNVTSSAFTWQELQKMDPSISANTIVVAAPDFEARKQYETWARKDLVAYAAWPIAMGVPAILSMVGAQAVKFSLTNIISLQHRLIDPNKKFAWSVASLATNIFDTDKEAIICAFMRLVEKYLVPDLSLDDQMGFRINVHSSLYGETTVEIELNGQPKETFMVPTYADSLLTPLITKESFPRIVHDLEHVLHVAAESELVHPAPGTYGAI